MEFAEQKGVREIELKDFPRGLKGMQLSPDKQKIVRDVIELLEMKELSVHEADEILKTVSNEIHIEVMYRKL